MLPTSYLPHQTLAITGGKYLGSVCQWYYTFKENIATWPAVNPATGFLATEPTLQNGATWYGPVNLPNSITGFTQATAKAKAGNYYKTKFSTVMPGFASNNFINLSNIGHKEIVIVAQLRSGFFWVALGNNKHGLDVDIEVNTGIGSKSVALNKLSFSGESARPIAILPSFAGVNSLPSVTPGTPITIPGVAITISDKEEIDFNTNGDTIITWDVIRLARFGNLPVIELYSYDGIRLSVADIPIIIDGYPTTTSITVQNAGGIGKIIIK